MDSYDAWSALSMSYNTGEPRSPAPLARPDAQLPPYLEKKKRRRYTVKATESLAAEVYKQTISGCELQPKTQQANRIDEEVQPGYEPQQISRDGENIPQDARGVFDDMVELFLTQRKCVSVDTYYSLFRKSTRTYLRSNKRQRR